jgi:1-deoxy-D-xylulose-5-phosphate synthase
VVAVYSTFLTRAMDQINLDVGLHHLPVVFVADRAGITGDDGPSHHGVLDMVLLTKVPDMTVFAPSSYGEVAQMLHDALDLCTEGPSLIRFAKTMPPTATPDDVGSGLSARLVRSGEGSIAIVGVGKMLGPASEAAATVADQGTSITVWDPRVVKPLDLEMLHDLARHDLVITIEDGLRDGGVGSAIADALRDLASAGGPAVRVLGVPSAYIPHGKPDVILTELGLNTDGIVSEINAWSRADAAS